MDTWPILKYLGTTDCNCDCAGFACVLESLTLLLTKIQVPVFFSDASTFHGKVSLSDSTLLQEISNCFCQRIGSLYSGIASGFHSLNCRCFLIFQLYLVYLCYQVCHCLWYEEPFSHWTSSQVPTKTMVNGLLMENIFSLLNVSKWVLIWWYIFYDRNSMWFCVCRIKGIETSKARYILFYFLLQNIFDCKLRALNA